MTDELAKRNLLSSSHSDDRRFDYTVYSHARLGMGHTGGHLKTNDALNFQCGFAQAKDAVFSDFDTDSLSGLCESLQLRFHHVVSQASDLYQFLMRPDLGRLLPQHEVDQLQLQIQRNAGLQYQDVLIVISGGLSPLAIRNQIPEFLPALIKKTEDMKITTAPIIINPRGRVALGDQLNVFFKAKVVVMLIGERPGLTTADSMGVYITHDAKPGCTDHMRQCISNIHQHGLSNAAAVEKLCEIMNELVAKKLEKE